MIFIGGKKRKKLVAETDDRVRRIRARAEAIKEKTERTLVNIQSTCPKKKVKV